MYKREQILSYARASRLTAHRAQAQNALPRIFAVFIIPNLPKLKRTLGDHMKTRDVIGASYLQSGRQDDI